MIYIFEDDERDPLSKLFMLHYYSCNTKNKIIHSRGNGNIENIIIDKLNNTNENIIVYFDISPGNDVLHRLYKKFRFISLKNNYRVIVLPIIGSEYYFIKSIKNENIHNNINEINNCIELKSFFNSDIIETDEDKKYCIYYERYCKLIITKLLKDCANNINEGDRFRYYYEKDCKCKIPDSNCTDKYLLLKSEDFIRSYPCFPGGCKLDRVEEVHEDDLWNIHRRLVDSYNKLCNELKNDEPNKERIKLYKDINYIK